MKRGGVRTPRLWLIFSALVASLLIMSMSPASAQFYVRSPDVEKGELKLEEHGAVYSGPGEDERRRQSHELEAKYGFTDQFEGIAELTARQNIGDSLKWHRFELGGQYAELRRRFPQINVLGGCCGTDHRHVESIGTACRQAA